MTTLTKDRIISYLRSALHNLYYPDQLRRSPFIDFFGLGQRFDAASLLQHILVDAIENLKPGQEEPPQSRSWRIYDALEYRYVRQFDRDLVADQLGISGRQLRREQRTALEALADYLWKEYPPDTKIAAIMEGPNQNELETSIPDKPIPEELSWLTSVPNDGPTVVTKVMDAVLNLAKHLADRSNVQIYCRQDENLPDLGMPSLALRHILLTLLNVLIPRARGKSVNISVYSTGKNLMIEIDGQDSSEQPAEVMDLSQKNLMVVNQITQLFGGSFTLLDNPGHFSARLAFPAIAKIPVLVIDDNPDSLLLLQRYASGTRYEVSGVHETDKAINLAEKLYPRVIFLDIMMPGVDGWEVLSQIRQQPLTSAIPVVVVSILPQESLALALGANAFLQKPINQKDFIDLLNQFVSEN